MALPIYQLNISEELDDNTGVDYVALVDFPAIEKDFMAFGKDRLNYAIQDEEKRIVSGAAMIADLPIYRNSPKMGEHYTVFSKDTIWKIVKKWSKMQYHNNVNLMHQTPVEGVYLIESFVSDSERGIKAPNQFADIAEGSWFLTYYIENDEVWQRVKDGTFKGFSIEGFFDYEEPNTEAEDFRKALELTIKLIKKYVEIN